MKHVVTVPSSYGCADCKYISPFMARSIACATSGNRSVVSVAVNQYSWRSIHDVKYETGAADSNRLSSSIHNISHGNHVGQCRLSGTQTRATGYRLCQVHTVRR